MKQIDKKLFGSFIAQKRKEKSMTQQDLADKVYVSAQAVSKWERGKSLPDITLLIPLANILDVSLVSLLEGKEEVDPKAEDLLEKMVGINEDVKVSKGKINKKRLGILLIILAAVCLEYLILYKKFNLEIANFLTPGILGVIFSTYLWLAVDERLPSYYDENKISFVAQGIFRMNMVGVYFNNKNWKKILTYLRIWIILLMVIYPMAGFLNDKYAMIAMAVVIITTFAPIYIISMKNQ